MIFKNKYNLSRHIHSAHEDSTLLQCDLYKKHFQRKRELLYHIKNKHPKSELGCECPKCGHKFIRRDSLTRHLRVECGIPPRFICSLCHYKTHFKYNLQKHIVRVHEWELNSPQ